MAALVEAAGLERVGFLTLTFADHVLDPREAQRRLNSLTTHVLRPRYGRGLRVFERQKSGRIHYHLLVVTAEDIRTGAHFGEFAKGDYRSASNALRSEWAFWRSTAKKFGFGRTELLPIQSSAQAVGRYVGKYIGKHLEVRSEADHGVRLVSYIGERVASTRFAWASPGAAEWRAKVGLFVTSLHAAGVIRAPTFEAMAFKFGGKWVYQWRDTIAGFPLDGGEAPVALTEGESAAFAALVGVSNGT